MEDKKINTFSTFYEELNALNEAWDDDDDYSGDIDELAEQMAEGLIASETYSKYFTKDKYTGYSIRNEVNMPDDVKVNFLLDVVDTTMSAAKKTADNLEEVMHEATAYLEDITEEVTKIADAKIKEKYKDLFKLPALADAQYASLKDENGRDIRDLPWFKIVNIAEDGTITIAPEFPSFWD